VGIRLSGRTEYGEIAPADDPVAPWHARCWCDPNARLVSFAAGYLRCTACDTLVCAMPPVRSTAGVVDDAADFYGARYWTSHQTESLGNPAIAERARDDLAERCIYWLRALLGYRRAPARLLEIGASHGGFLRLAQLAGFDATGIELSPSVVRFAQRTFDVDMRVGPLEAAGIAGGAFDVVVAFDVLEHFDDPEAALREIRRVLRPGGIVVLQTPDYPVRDADELLAANDPFLAHLRAPEHVFLFSKRAAVNILARTGFPCAAFAPPLFGYDMFVVAGTELPVRGTRDDVARALLASPDGRVVLALIDLFERGEQMRTVAAERLTVIEGLNEACGERLAVIELLDRALKQRS
jgi:SAM-dependent methyltransferase